MGSTGGSSVSSSSSSTKSGGGSSVSSRLWAAKFWHFGRFSSVFWSHSWVRGLSHILLTGQRVPCIMIFLSALLISSVFLVNLALSLCSHNNPIEISDPFSSGKMCAILVALGISGQSSSPVCVDLID